MGVVAVDGVVVVAVDAEDPANAPAALGPFLLQM